MRRIVRFLLVATAVLVGLKVSKWAHSNPAGLFVRLPAKSVGLDCGDSSILVLQVSKEHVLKINSEIVSKVSLGKRLGELYQHREEAILFITADPDVSFQEVVKVLEITKKSIPQLCVVLLTPDAEKEPCLFINWPLQPPKLPGLSKGLINAVIGNLKSARWQLSGNPTNQELVVDRSIR
jgi:biopolymer transport protein ExbD